MQKISKAWIRKPTLLGLITLIACLALSALPTTYSFLRQKEIYHEDFRASLGKVVATLAQSIDGDLHDTLKNSKEVNSLAYFKTISPLTRFHNLNPEIFNIYTVIEVEGKRHYILDTCNDPAYSPTRKVNPVTPMEEVFVDEKYGDYWFELPKKGQVYVNNDFETDNYGTYISGHAPFYNSKGEFAGILGIDYNAKGYHAQMQNFTRIFAVSIAMAMTLSILAAMIVTKLTARLKESYEEVENLSYYDRLTGLLNRFIFMEFFEKEIEKVKRSGDNLYLIFLDIDNFKSFNDLYGHKFGDEAIRVTAKKLQALTRRSDCVARYGGDEFLAWVTEKEEQDINTIVERILHGTALSSLDIVDENGITKNVPIRLSIGYTKYQGAMDSSKQMLARADKALYISKENGRHQATFMPSRAKELTV